MSRPENRLAREASPYLLQHKHNPVDWYPWGPEAFERARREDRPILLSVGYAACHWCHVMEHDAFEVEAVAELMNRHFVSIKVDREERPDVDQLYQGVVQLMGRGGGWPLTVFLTPDLRPFFGGTYFPPVDRHGLPGFSRLLEALAEAWSSRRAELLESAESFHEGLGKLSRVGLSGAPGELSAQDLVEAGSRLLQEVDAQHGGFFGAPKFPNTMALSFLLRLATAELPGLDRSTKQAAERAVRLSLTKMARGGIYDQLAGGFARYSVDDRWAVPHFEKMLYDNALLVRIYAEAAVAFGDPLHARVARETAAYLARELQDPAGGFFSSQDADSEGVEGKYFVFTRAELDAILGAELGALAAAHLGVTQQGNFEHGNTVLQLARTAEELSASTGEAPEPLAVRLADARAKLLAFRATRVPPATDDKVLAGWNGLAIGGLAAAGRLLGEPSMVESARKAATFVLGTLLVDGRLCRVTRAGKVQQDAFVDDHACLVEGLLELFEATGEEAWLTAAGELAAALLERFWDEAAALFWVTPADGEALLHRQLSVHDNALPAGASSAAVALLRLAALTGDSRAQAVAERYLASRREALLRNPFAFGHLLGAAFLQVKGISEVAVLGPQGPEREALLQAARSGFQPEILAFAAARGPGLLAGRGEVEGRPAAHVCRRFACEAPRTEPGELRAALGLGAGARGGAGPSGS